MTETSPAPPCALCGDIPASCGACAKVQGESYGSMPGSAQGLAIVGAPLFDDGTGGSNWCMKRCRACGALFEWTHQYDFLVNGSEDSTDLERLDDAGARRAVRKLFERLLASTRPSSAPPTALSLAGGPTAVPVNQPGTTPPPYPTMELLRARAPMPGAELLEILEAHARFVAGGGAGGGWALARSAVDHAEAIIFAFYGCPPGATAGGQARLELSWLVPVAGGRPLELPSSCLIGARCRDTDLAGASLAGAMLVRADLAGSSLRGASLGGADCSGGSLVGCDLRDADLRGTDFENADLEGADLRGARVEGASFLGTRTIGVKLSGS